MGQPHSPNRARHKHAELIKAWADGAEIQFRGVDINSDWKDVYNNHPAWLYNVEYRIKPKTIRYRSYLYRETKTFYLVYTTCDVKNGIENHPNFVRWLTDWVEVEV